MIAGGNAYFNHYINRSLDQQQTSVVISPQFGLAFADNFIAGAYFQFSSFSDVSSWGAGELGRLYAIIIKTSTLRLVTDTIELTLSNNLSLTYLLVMPFSLTIT